MKVLITGTGRGIGLALVKEYLNLGHAVIATYRCDEALKTLNSLPQQDQLSTYPLEVTDSNSIKALTTQLQGQAIDLLINNAGIYGGSEQSLTNLNTEQWKQTLAVNTIAPIELTLALLINLRAAEQAKVITISSMMASLARNRPDFYAYRSSKAALNKALQCLSLDLKPEGILVCPVHPGWVQTDMGGAEADITVDECIAGLIPTIERLSIEQTGEFYSYSGEVIPW